MNHSQIWSADGPLQACMLPADYITEPLIDDYCPRWPSAQEQGCQSAIGEHFVNGDQHKPVHDYGMLSPAPTATAASPPNWSGDGPSTVSGAWAPVSPISPSEVGFGGEGLGIQLGVMPRASVTTTPPTLQVGPRSWAASAGLDVCNNTYLGYATATSLPHRVGVPVGLYARWTGEMAAPNLPDESFPQASFAIPSDSATIWNNNPRVQPEHTLPPRQADPCIPNSLSKRSQSRTQQTSKRANPSSTPLNKTTVPAVTTTTSTTSTRIREEVPVRPTPNAAISTKPSTSTSITKGSTLRTATRRVKRPASSSPKPGEPPERQRARANHNLVEQQYRHRLHAQFEALLEALPERMLDGEGQNNDSPDGDRAKANNGGVGGRDGSKRRRMSKADVLTRAARVIRDLEGDIELVRREVEGLRRERQTVLGRVRSAWEGRDVEGRGGGFALVGERGS
ncbi:hypothetical protein N657DRAFT_639596 [Parathielavia appendiculata]|uniref:BHLH domain-containing protein n=1 Tax=Parathielavia appendiculata TaxID=2587402 RepID=A0AAN6U9V9_9PEZI|nr:hypothetical protein N657DRAFT_639596 [Parathielavia appendiculata]